MSQRKAGEQTVWNLPGGVPMQFAWCPAGSFLMGSPETEPDRCADERQHPVTLTRGFWMGIHPVTQAQWNAVMERNPSVFPGHDLPVDNVSWEDALDFCRIVHQQTEVLLRLPTEAEWEYAARGGTQTPFFWGETLNGIQANCFGSYPYGTDMRGPFLARTSAVGDYASCVAHPWGLTDVIGNVWEWCSDWYSESYYDPLGQRDPAGPATGTSKVIRGGSWYNDPWVCRVAYRGRRAPDFRYDYHGFRLAADALPMTGPNS